jgi:phage gpG-like protein
MRITATVGNEVQFDREMLRFAERVGDLRITVWPAVTAEMARIWREHFAGEGVGPAGRWPPLSANYARWKMRNFPGKTILRRTDRMYRSLVGKTADSIHRPTADSLEIGTSVPYANFHQTGTGRMPARRIIDLNEVQKTRIMKAIHQSVFLNLQNP